MFKKLLLAIFIISFACSGLSPALAKEPARPELTPYQLYWNILKVREKVEVKEKAFEQARLELQQSLIREE
ncbi:hypothetical protein [Desulfofundulus salinus]|uniref:TolC family protein n=1 Tax=Desulfofundulus salinus TaxID=2419843 RepID=A0A494WRZ3_9FIRM|nr:hypothetical protein [Desulfofundulus salinum]RKO65581.1 hypothetical protein D7024_00425 [Desulfofundulus salinum]